MVFHRKKKKNTKLRTFRFLFRRSQSEKIVEGFYRIEIVHSGQFLTATPERSTLVQQDENPNVKFFNKKKRTTCFSSRQTFRNTTNIKYFTLNMLDIVIM